MIISLASEQSLLMWWLLKSKNNVKIVCMYGNTSPSSILYTNNISALSWRFLYFFSSDTLLSSFRPIPNPFSPLCFFFMPVIVTLELFDSIHGTDAYTYLHTCSNQVAHVYDSVCVCVCLCTQNRYIQHIQTIFVAFAEEKKVEKKKYSGLLSGRTTTIIATIK